MSSIQEITRSVSLGTCFNRGLEVYKANVVTLVIATLLVGLIACVSLGICAAPMLCGLYAMVLAMLRTGAKPEVGDVFKKCIALPTQQSFCSSAVLCLASSPCWA